jgi:hypothetical protein
MTPVPCHILPTPTAKATDHSPANSHAMHSRLISKNKYFGLGEPAYVPKNPNKFQNPQKTFKHATTTKKVHHVSKFSNTLFDKKSPVHLVLGPGQGDNQPNTKSHPQTLHLIY